MAASLSAHGLGPADGLPQPTRLKEELQFLHDCLDHRQDVGDRQRSARKRVPLPRASSRGFSLFQLGAPGPRRFVLLRAQIAKGYCKRRYDVGVCPPPRPRGDATGASAAAAIYAGQSTQSAMHSCAGCAGVEQSPAGGPCADPTPPAARPPGPKCAASPESRVARPAAKGEM